MLTTIGDKIIEIRPKQIIESNIQIDNNYLVPLNKKSDPSYKYVKKVTKVTKVTKATKVTSNEELPQHSPRHTQTEN